MACRRIPLLYRRCIGWKRKAGVSLGYLSEVERGQKEASSELLSSISDALGVSTAQMLRMVADYLESVER